jgi:2-oxo-4-hydroxy-4-carboxy-5-ureidoimidazoline decarboxylase
MTLADLNALDRDAFVDALGWIFEHSPWVAERAWVARPFAGLAGLHTAMVEQVASASREEQLALLCAHPDLGTRARVSDASRGEQAGAGLDQLTPDEFARLSRWNVEYRERFGFPFLFAVKGSTKHDVLRALDARRHADKGAEFHEALQQVYRIARFRLESELKAGQAVPPANEG